MNFLVMVNGELYEISELVTKVTYTDKLNDGCSKLEFSYIDDDLVIENGSTVRFIYDNAQIFYGFVFKVERGRGKEISVIAYDQLRYCKAKDTFSSVGDTAITLITKMCNRFGLNKGTLTDTKYILPTRVFDNQTWLDIIYTALSDTLIGKGQKYALRDEFGSIALRDLESLNTNLILGDESLCYDFSYGKSIDDNFYNLIRIQDKNNSQFIEEKDKTSINKYGALQYFEEVSEQMNASQIKAKANMLLKLYNKESETLSLDCLGDTSIRAGSSFYANISDIGINKRLIVKKATHNYSPIYTMSLEVSI